MSREKFNKENGTFDQYERRTIISYKRALQKITGSKQSDCQGVKFDSVFNRLDYYHVCDPGLPPCLGHDLLESVVAHDLKLYIDTLIELKWFSLNQLNARINKFAYSIEDQRDKPCIVKKDSEKIPGGAWQICNFLRLFPLIVNDLIQDIHNEIWKNILPLNKIVELVVAPETHINYLPYLHQTINSYLYMGQTLFPKNKLRPKHHYFTLRGIDF